ncbi:MAG: hypothetical protein GOVbin1573_26 [Prokaryotic dsDNA virus sp.]|nr:MAG: hypothetical protein GOVbin1573_26 [Prokaryotic dsDNA virus sp.]|tara:strand:- start:2064 stop:2318 length:255 start_codon:yes stop_codon:yes gene_type:complete
MADLTIATMIREKRRKIETTKEGLIAAYQVVDFGNKKLARLDEELSALIREEGMRRSLAKDAEISAAIINLASAIFPKEPRHEG